MDDDWDAPSNATGAWDEDTGFDFGGGGDWDAEEEVVEEKPKVVAKAAAKPAAVKAPVVKKLTPKEVARQKEAAEAEERAAAEARTRREQELMKDPNYLANRKEQERRDMEESESKLASDLFGGCKAPSKATVTSPESDRALALAASSGLFDGADGMAGINSPDEKTGPAAPPSVLDGLDLNNKDQITSFSIELARKMNDYNNSTSSTLLLKELFGRMGAGIKHDDLAELLRVVTVAKNDASKALQNKKKKSKKPQIKAVGSSNTNDYDGYDDEEYDY